MIAQVQAGRRGPRGWLPVASIALVIIPGAGGVARLVELAGGPTSLPAKPHVTESPLPLTVHIIAALAFAVLGESEHTNALMQGAGWVINLAIAERANRRRPSRRATPAFGGSAVA